MQIINSFRKAQSKIKKVRKALKRKKKTTKTKIKKRKHICIDCNFGACLYNIGFKPTDKKAGLDCPDWR